MIEKLGQNFNWNHASLQDFPYLAADELHLWWLPLHLDHTQLKPALHLLSDIQRDKYHRRATAQLKQNYLAGRYYLLNLLAAYTEQAPSEVRLSYSRLNKPSLSDPSLAVEFNFTDTNGYGVFAFSRGRQVGVDIESRARKINFKAIADRRFTKQELEFVYQNGELNTQRCLAIWTRKEAYGKATGLGINFKMNQQNLYSAENDAHQHTFLDSDGEPWRCLQLQLGEQMIASVVHQQHQELAVKSFKSLTIDSSDAER
ncbi:MAG: 4'-phosphopantetheinyl transferase superfamily protein [Arenicella sp.]|nr:4'-phosphopantetheinyl transferase superfamily protein [Arenicella sp.]